MKQGEGKDIARELYVYEQCTFDEIAKRIGRSDKTVREWAKDDDWKGQREQILKDRYKTHEKIQSVVHKLCDRISLSYDQSEEIDKDVLKSLDKLVDLMQKTFSYNNKAKIQQAADSPKDVSEGLSEETLQWCEQQMKIL